MDCYTYCNINNSGYKEELIDKTLNVAAQLTGVAFAAIKEEQYDDIEEC